VLDNFYIELLQKNSFVSLTELEELYLYECGTRTVELGAFNGLKKLTFLSMYVNEISELLTGTFDSMSSLEHLDISNNRIEHLDRDIFSGLVKLKFIDLSVNELLYLHPDTFLGLPNLQQLELRFNLGLQIPTNRKFINSHSLSHLDISRCSVSSLSVDSFANVSALEVFNLSRNNLRNIDINILRALPKLSALYLFGNPLQFDCQLLKVWRWCEDHNIQTVRYYLSEYDTPKEVEGIGLVVLENGQCLDGNIQFYWDYNGTSYENLYPAFLKTSQDTEPEEYTKQHGYEFPSLESYELPVFTFPFIFGTAGNFILLIIIICNKDMRTVPNMYILSLSISDIIYLTVLFSEAFEYTEIHTWSGGGFMCTFPVFCRRMSVGLSAYSVALYSFQRYRVTASPLQFRVSSQTEEVHRILRVQK
jgi:hypothetical protein